MREADDRIWAVLTLVPDPSGRLLPLDDLIFDVELRAVERELGVPLPPSYVAFLRCYGSGWVAGHELYGIPRHRLWGDVVLMNGLGTRTLPSAFVKFSRDRQGREYYLDTARPGPDGECPVIVLGVAGGISTVAAGFLDYLHKAVGGEPGARGRTG